MRKTLIRMLGGYTDPGLKTVKASEMTSSTVNRNFTNIVVEVKTGNLEIKVSAWDDAQATRVLNQIFDSISTVHEKENTLISSSVE